MSAVLGWPPPSPVLRLLSVELNAPLLPSCASAFGAASSNERLIKASGKQSFSLVRRELPIAIATRLSQRIAFMKIPLSRPHAFPDSLLYDRLSVVLEGAMKFVGLFIPMILLIAASAMAQQQAFPESQNQSQNQSQSQNPNTELPFPSKPNALIICAGDVPPENMVITASGTSVTCAGSCRSRQIEPVDGPIMVICAGQAIPQYYETESVTSLPACNCIGDQDNAYVIRRGNNAPTPTPAAPQGLPGSASGAGSFPARNR